MRILIKGIVQGVGFRPFIYRLAQKYQLKGFIRNLGTGEVEIVVKGSGIRDFQKEIPLEKPPLAQIDSFYVEEDNFAENEFSEFSIKASEEKGKRPSFIPPDVALCDNCLREMQTKGNRREKYYFTSCTDCGPRFTIIKDMPYDRPNTTMVEFPLCSECGREYQNPLDRRYHAQPIACAKCGPPIYLYNQKGEKVASDYPIKEAASLIDAGYVLAIKGIGGMHLVMRTSEEEPLQSFRKNTGRPTKPYAVMARDLAAVKDFAQVSLAEEELLLSGARPIVALQKKENAYPLAPTISHLHTIGVMLPYTGLHYLLFEYTKEKALVMTSANLPGLPMTKDNEEAFLLPADYFLLHEREIYMRCDDSVVRMINQKPVFLRRSRGWVPLPTQLPRNSSKIIVALGAEQNTAACLVRDDKAIMTQFLGTIKNIETEEYYRDTLRHFLRIFRVSFPELVVCDLHPQYETTNIAKEIVAEHASSKLIQVQHHLAHFASVLAEQREVIDDAIGLVCDGTGYGLDGKIWGGEVFTYRQGMFARIAHLENQPQVGGDLATKYPGRIALGILSKVLGEKELNLLAEGGRLALRNPIETKLVLQQLKSGQGMTYTSSTGRLLDALVALLGICQEMTYEGEPAMLLEATAFKGNPEKYSYDLPIQREDGLDVLMTTSLLAQVYEGLKAGAPIEDLAASAQRSLAKGLVSLVLHTAEKTGIKQVCCSGGVFYNNFFSTFIAKELMSQGLEVFFNQQVGAERMTSHTGTETRSRLLREAAVGNIAQWAQA